MERGVEAGDSGDVGKKSAHNVDSRQGLGLVEGGEINQIMQGTFHGLVDENRPCEQRATVNDAVADGVDSTLQRADRVTNRC